MNDQRAPDRPGRRLLLAAGLFFFALLVRWPLIALPGYPADQTYFALWSGQTVSQGMAEPYRQRAGGRFSCNYPPSYVIVLRGLGHLYNTLAPAGVTLDEGVALAVWHGDRTDAVRLGTTLFKVPAALADALLASLLFAWLAVRLGNLRGGLVAAIYALSPAVLHNSSIWGQVDAIPTLVMVISLQAALRGRVLWMTAWATLAVLTKAQALALAPVWAATAWLWIQPAPRRLWQLAAVGLGVTSVLVFPFVGALDGVWHAYAGAANLYPFRHLNGFSAWFLSASLDQPHLEDELSHWYRRDNVDGFLGIWPRVWGMFGVMCLWVSVFATLIWSRCDGRSLAWAARVLPLGFFVLTTQMHERYLFPTVALWAWAAIPSWRWWVCWILIGACAAANAMWVWAGPAGAPWTAPILGLLRGSGTGVACSVVLIAVLAAAVIDWPSNRQRSPPGKAGG